jgi:hypothetical protein
MNRYLALFALAMLICFDGLSSPETPVPVGICELSKSFPAHREKVVAVRGVYYYGLRQDDCPEKCASGPWPSFINLQGGTNETWDALAKVAQKVEADAKTGRRFEIWVTVTGRLQTRVGRSPCDRGSWQRGGFGHLGVFPSQIEVESFRDIEVKENPRSPYDYGNMYHGPA